MRVTIFFTIMLLIVIGSAMAQPQPPDTLWTHTYGGINSDVGACVQLTNDGGFVTFGTTSSFGQGQQMYLVKTDANGIQQWYRTYGGANDEYGEYICQTNDGGFILVGWTQSYGSGAQDVYLIKTNQLGDTLWTKTYGTSNGNDDGRCVQQTQDGGYIIVGRTMNPPYWYDVYLIKTDANGNSTWTRTFHAGTANHTDVCEKVEQTNDGGYILGGYSSSATGGSPYQGYIIKTNSLGIEEWHNLYPGLWYSEFYCIQKTADGGYIASGFTNTSGNPQQCYYIKINNLGILQWDTVLGGPANDRAEEIKETSTNQYISAGCTYSFGAGNADVFTVKLDINGDSLWSRTVGGISADFGNSIQITDDGGYIVAGSTSSYGMGSNDLYLIRFECEEGPVTIILTPHNPPIQIPAGGGSFVFDLDITNNTTNLMVVDIWTSITLPGGAQYQIISKPNRNIPAGAVISVDNLTQMVPGTALAGNYIYNGYIRDHNTWQVLAEDSFPFTKLPGDDAPNHNLGWALLGWDEPADNTFRLSPLAFSLAPASPNPFNSSVVLRFELSDARGVELLIYDISGREVWRLASGISHLGTNEVVWDAEGMPSGIYFARLSAISCQLSASGSQSMVQKLLLLK